MNIAIVGTGNVGGTLGRAWAAKGHEILWRNIEAGQPRGGIQQVAI